MEEVWNGRGHLSGDRSWQRVRCRARGGTVRGGTMQCWGTWKVVVKYGDVRNCDGRARDPGEPGFRRFSAGAGSSPLPQRVPPPTPPRYEAQVEQQNRQRPAKKGRRDPRIPSAPFVPFGPLGVRYGSAIRECDTRVRYASAIRDAPHMFRHPPCVFHKSWIPQHSFQILSSAFCWESPNMSPRCVLANPHRIMPPAAFQLCIPYVQCGPKVTSPSFHVPARNGK
eukprot:gene14082-biopygen5743